VQKTLRIGFCFVFLIEGICYLTDDATQEGALAHVNEAHQLCIDTAKEFGGPISEPK